MFANFLKSNTCATAEDFEMKPVRLLSRSRPKPKAKSKSLKKPEQEKERHWWVEMMEEDLDFAMVSHEESQFE